MDISVLRPFFYGMDPDFRCDMNLGKYDTRRSDTGKPVRAISWQKLGSSRVCVRRVASSILMRGGDELVLCHRTLLYSLTTAT